MTPDISHSESNEGRLQNLMEIVPLALQEANDFLDRIIASLKARIAPDGKVQGALLEQHQDAAHALSWVATNIEGLRQMLGWASKLEANGQFGEAEQLILQIAFGEYLAQLRGGIPMSQNEMARPELLGAVFPRHEGAGSKAVWTLIRSGNSPEARMALVAQFSHLEGHASYGATGLDEESEMIRTQFRRFADEKIAPKAHQWHLEDALIPIELIQEMAELGVFGLTIPEEYGGFGLSKTAMCIVSEELSRGYIGVGSLGTRSEIAAELILGGGTEAQKQKWLPKLANGEVLPTAVFTEPNTGSDLGSLRTRAEKHGEEWKISGNKTWITHAARANLMTLLARTNPENMDYRGLSMFLAEKTPGEEHDPFPDAGMSGGEIKVLGYRGMKEYELGFDGFAVKDDNLLGGAEGEGFKQLMRTFESARIQTAARAIGVAQSAFEISLRYAQERVQFDKPLLAFPRVAGKLALMVVEIMIARQLCYYAAREKDAGRRSDLEAGMAKLLAARIAWSAADCGLQIHGGNGFALEYEISRVLCDARILNIFEGAAEIQAQIIARRLLE